MVFLAIRHLEQLALTFLGIVASHSCSAACRRRQILLLCHITYHMDFQPFVRLHFQDNATFLDRKTFHQAFLLSLSSI